jgi:hypothetical protein
MLKYRRSIISQTFTFLSVLVIVLTLGGCAAVYRSGFVSVPRQPISSAVTIGSEWVEIIPPAPLIPYGSSQYIDLECDGYKKTDWSSSVDNENVLELADGRITKIEAFLFDNKGQGYELKVYQTSAGPELVRKGKVKWSGEANFSEADYSEVNFPPGSVFTKLRIQSQIPLKCSKIEWTGGNQK